MQSTATLVDFRETAVWVAVVSSLLLLVCAGTAQGAGPRAVTSHVVVGLTQNAGFTVQVNGSEIPSSPVIAGDLGIISFNVDESGFPEGPRTVVIGDPGDLVISDIHVDGITESSAVVHWSTNLPSNSRVFYGPTSSYGEQSSVEHALLMTHAVELSGLDPGTTYHYSVSSDDGQGHASSSSDRTFETGATIPLVITGARVDTAGQTWAVVSWETNLPASSLVEYGLTTAYGSYTPIDASLVVSHSVTILGLEPGTTYHVRTHSSDGAGGYAVSSDREFETAQVPLSLSGLDVTWVGATSATVVWTTNRPADSRVEYGPTESYGSTTATHPTLVVEHEVTLTDLVPGTLYHFRAWSAESGGQAEPSGDQTLTTDLLPLGLWDVEVEQVGPTWAIVTWLTDRPATSLVSYGETAGYGDVEIPGTGFVSEHSATLSGLAEGTLYHFRVESADEDLVAASGADSTFTTLEGEPTGPPQMDGVAYTPTSATSVTISWTTDRPATSQVLYGTNGEVDSSTEVDVTLVTEHSVAVWPVAPRAEYTFVVVSACGSDTTCGALHTFYTVPPAGQTPDVRPVEIIKIVIDTEETSAVVTWLSDRPCSSWVDYGGAALNYGETAPGVPLGGSAYWTELTGLSPGVVYHFRICAWDVAGGEVTGEDSVFETSVPPDETPPLRPTGLACELEDAGVRAEWRKNSESDLLGYNVYRARAREYPIDWSRAEVLNLFPLSDTSFLDASAEPGGAYAYAVSAVDESGNESELSESVSVSVAELATLRFAAYPNPVRDDASFAFTLPHDVTAARLRIISTSGRVVMERNVSYRASGEQVLTWNARDSSGWPVAGGVYLCELSAGDQVARSKITILE